MDLMIIDCHVHVTAFTGGRGSVSRELLDRFPSRFLRWHFGIAGSEQAMEQGMLRTLLETIEQTPELDAAVVLAFDAVYTPEGQPDPDNTHLYVSNDYVADLARRHHKLLFGASVHPYRKDAVAEIERCVRQGAALMKWLPVTQRFNPADRRCIPVYEALAHYKLPLLCHTGGENTLPVLDRGLASPVLLEAAIKRGVRVIAAHCGTRAMPWEEDYLDDFLRMAREHEHFYGDTAALSVPTRWYALDRLLKDETVRAKLVHGSDWPIISLPPIGKMGLRGTVESMGEGNWMRRDVLIKKRLGLGEEYWRRAARVIRRAENPGD